MFNDLDPLLSKVSGRSCLAKISTHINKTTGNLKYLQLNELQGIIGQDPFKLSDEEKTEQYDSSLPQLPSIGQSDSREFPYF